jgi:hypothetical protein
MAQLAKRIMAAAKWPPKHAHVVLQVSGITYANLPCLNTGIEYRAGSILSRQFGPLAVPPVPVVFAGASH